MQEGLRALLLRIARLLLAIGHAARRFFERLQRVAHLPGDQFQRLRVEAALLERREQLRKLRLRLGPARSLQKAPGVEALLQRALQAAEVDAQGRLPEDARQLIGPALQERLRKRRHLREQAGDLLQLLLVELLRRQRVEQRALQPLDQILRAGKVQLEEAVEHGRVLAALDQRRPQRAAKDLAILEADQQHRLGRVGQLRGRDAQAVLSQETGKIFQALVHRSILRD